MTSWAGAIGGRVLAEGEQVDLFSNREIESRDLNPQGVPMKKLSRKEIREGLDAVPIEAVILGAASKGEKRLTAKQREFARQIALGETKAGAYRKSRESKAKPASASREGQELMKNPAIASQVEAFRAAFEAQKYATPAHLRALTIHELTKHALDESFPPAQRMKALELLGKITEVALFTERREVVQVTDASQIRERLMASLRLALKNDAIDVEARSADDLLAEISGGNIDPAADGEAIEIAPAATPPGGDPLDATHDTQAYMHSNPHIESAHLPDVSSPSTKASLETD